MRTVIVALQGVRSEPVRSVLVVVALTLGMLGFVSVVAADRVLADAVTQRALLQGGPVATFVVTTTAPKGVEDLRTVQRQLAARTGAIHSALSVEAPEVTLWAGGAPQAQVAVSFVSPDLQTVRPFYMTDGTWISGDELLAPTAVVNGAALRLLQNLGPLAVGTQSSRTAATVIGIVEDGLTTPQAYVDIESVMPWWGEVANAKILLTAPSLNADNVRSDGIALTGLGSALDITGVERMDTVEQLADELAATSRVLLVLGAVSLLSTVVGIANLGLATARARASEFTMRRTFGASRWQIASITMLESQTVAIIAAAAATGLSYLLFPTIVGAFQVPGGISPPAYSIDYGILCLVVASATALISSLAPAFLSFRRDISGVMRQ